MKLLMDENVSRHIAERLRLDGHTIIFGQHVAAGRPDHEVLAHAVSVGAIVVTEDNDFGNLVMRQHLASAGVILLRLSGMDRASQPDFIAQIVSTHAAEIPGSFTVVSPTGVRIRILP